MAPRSTTRSQPVRRPSVPTLSVAPRLLAWYDLHGRHGLPWQNPRSPYRVWVSETMLQQTQVVTVVPYFQRFLDTLPDLAALAAAPPDQVLALWSGLGYYSRARRLQDAAHICMRHHAGSLPTDFEALLALPGIGRSTAGAILALAHDQPYPILDGNVRRVLCRHRGVRGWPGATATQKKLWRIAEQQVPAARAADYTQALMDLGATVCTPRQPECASCPLVSDCVAHQKGWTASLPKTRPSAPRPERQVHALVVCDDRRRVLLHRRPLTGLWASLWSLPEVDTAQAARRWLRSNGLAAGRRQTLPVIAHAISHVHLKIHPWLWRVQHPKSTGFDAPDVQWWSLDRLGRLALPAPIRRLLEGLPRPAPRIHPAAEGFR